MKITIEQYNEKFTFETETDDISLDRLHNIWERCLLAITFNEETIRKFYDKEE